MKNSATDEVELVDNNVKEYCRDKEFHYSTLTWYKNKKPHRQLKGSLYISLYTKAPMTNIFIYDVIRLLIRCIIV